MVLQPFTCIECHAQGVTCPADVKTLDIWQQTNTQQPHDAKKTSACGTAELHICSAHLLLSPPFEKLCIAVPTTFYTDRLHASECPSCTPYSYLRTCCCGKYIADSKHYISVLPADCRVGEDVQVKLSFPRDGSKATPPHPSGDFRWKDYSPLAFRQLREVFSIDAAQYMTSICGTHHYDLYPGA